MIMPSDKGEQGQLKSEEKKPVAERSQTETMAMHHDTPIARRRLKHSDSVSQGHSRSNQDVAPFSDRTTSNDEHKPPPLPYFSLEPSGSRTRTGGFQMEKKPRQRNSSSPEPRQQYGMGARYKSSGSAEQTTRYQTGSPVLQYDKQGRRISDPMKSPQSRFLPSLDKRLSVSTASPQTSLGSGQQCAGEYTVSSMSGLDLKEDAAFIATKSTISAPNKWDDDIPLEDTSNRDEATTKLVRSMNVSTGHSGKPQEPTLLSNLDPNQSVVHDFKFCRYQAKYISKGSQGEVYRGIDPTTKKVVAIKVTAPDESKFKLTNSMSELAIYRRLDKIEGEKNPNLCYSLGIHEFPKKTYVIMPWYPLSLLDAMTTMGRIPIVDSLTIILRLLNGVEYLHHVKIAHRDIKAENVLLTTPKLSNAQPVLCDYGLCGTMDSGAIMTSQCGSRSYAAPEVKNKNLRYTAGGGYDARKADMFSVGVLLFSMIHAFFPWSSANMEVASWKEWHDRPRVFFKWAAKHSDGVKLSNNFRMAFRGMCHPNPARRMSISGVRSLLEDEMKKEQSK